MILARRAALICVLFVTPSANAAPPVISGVVPRGWKAGPNDVVVQGANFTEAMQLLVDVPGAVVAVKAEPKPAANQVQYVVTLPPDLQSGVVELRAATDEGVTTPAFVLVDALATVAEVEPNNERAQAQSVTLPIAVEGRLGGSESDWIAFDGKKGQRVVAEIAARRIGCNMKPVLRLFTADRLELAAARPSQALGRDTRLVATLPADGRYFIELHDLLYRGDNNQYRLLLGDLQAADSVFPLGVRRGDNASVTLLGGTLASPIPTAVPMLSESQSGFAAALAPSGMSSPFRRAVVVSDRDEVMEQPAAAAGAASTPQTVSLGALVNGRIAMPGEEDRYQFAVTPESRLRITLTSARLGTPLDGVLSIRNEQGAALATADDSPGTTDPELFFNVPKDVKSIVVAVSDVNRRGGEAYAYRLCVEPVTGGDFELTLLTPLLNVSAGGSASIRVRAARREFTEPIRLKVVGDVPQGFEVRGAEIGTGTTDTLLSLTAPAGAPLKAGAMQIVGEAGPIEKPTLVRTAAVESQPAYDAAPWLRTRLSGAVAKAGLVSLTIEGTEPVAIRGQEYKAKVVAKRAEGQTGPIRLQALTSQLGVPGIVPVNPIPNLTIPENANEAEIRLQVPINATDMPMTFVVQGQLLDAKTKAAVVATTETPATAVRVVFPYVPEFAASQTWKRGVRNLVTGKLVRYGGFNSPVTIQITGLPPTFRTIPLLTVAGDATEFAIPVLVPPSQPPGAIPNLRLATNTPMNPPTLNQRQPLEIVVTVSADDPPASLEIFSEGDDFAAALVEGGGTATVEPADAAAGTQSLVVKGDRQRTALPGLNVPIAENPTPGQYRFLRFAWKKKGGQSARLQLAANNAFGGASPKMTDYRYVAGPLAEGSKSIPVTDAAPAEWTIVTRDLFADHGAFTLTGIGFSAIDGEALLIDHVWLGRTEADLPAAAK